VRPCAWASDAIAWSPDAIAWSSEAIASTSGPSALSGERERRPSRRARAPQVGSGRPKKVSAHQNPNRDATRHDRVFLRRLRDRIYSNRDIIGSHRVAKNRRRSSFRPNGSTSRACARAWSQRAASFASSRRQRGQTKQYFLPAQPPRGHTQQSRTPSQRFFCPCKVWHA
jgi:hypothetical protein